MRMRDDILKLASFVDESRPGWTRRPFTRWYEAGRDWLKEQMRACGMEVRVDAAANVIGRLQGSDPSLPSILIGSHLDTVTGGGRFDGILGVVAGLDVARRLRQSGTVLRHPLEVVDFTAEEPSDFGISTIGSRGMVNNLSQGMLERTDADGRRLREALLQAGGAPELLAEQARGRGDVKLYLELHIEQGPVLEQTGHKLGVVTGIVGIQRERVVVEGEPNHAGTTPMHLRRDALSGAAELMLALEAICRQPHETAVVGTVGTCSVEPNASNVIPGRVMFDYEVRSLSSAVSEGIRDEFRAQARRLAEARGLRVSFDLLSKSEPLPVDDRVQGVLEAACQEVAKTMRLPSGAGHDGNQLGRIAPIGMLFVPSAGGRSHCPEEWTDWEDAERGVEALYRAVLAFDREL